MTPPPHATQLGTKRPLLLILPLLLSACATYHAKPLPKTVDLTSTPTVRVPARALKIPGLTRIKAHAFNPMRGLDMTQLVTLAVLNNPGLKVQRRRAGVADAQLLQAGLLPNPVISADFLHPTGGLPPLYNGRDFGLAQELTALVSRGAARAAAAAHKKQVNLEILWQEWQVAQKARQLFIRARAEARLDVVLRREHDLEADNYRRDEEALRLGNMTMGAASANLVALVNTNTQIRRVERQRNRTWHKLDALLGLKPQIELTLRGPIVLRPFSKAEFHAALGRLSQRRPDLLALRAGYESQEQAVREAILKQFPGLALNFVRGSDTNNIQTIGFGVKLSLPLFNHNQGQIAIQRATRAALYQAYQARLDQADNRADEAWEETRIMTSQMRALDSHLLELRHAAAMAERSFRHGNLSANAYISLRSTLFGKQIEAIRLKASWQEAQAGLETLLGMTLDR